jgi:hypothetical protein
VTPNARRILRTAAEHRRSRATQRWFVHHAGLPVEAVKEGLKELAQSGLAEKLESNYGNPVFEVKTEGSDEM